MWLSPLSDRLKRSNKHRLLIQHVLTKVNEEHYFRCRKVTQQNLRRKYVFFFFYSVNVASPSLSTIENDCINDR